MFKDWATFCADKGFSASNQNTPNSMAVPKAAEIIQPFMSSKMSSVVSGFTVGILPVNTEPTH